MTNPSDAMIALERKYRASLAERINQLSAQFNKLNLSDWQRADLAELHHQVHSLTGSAGTFGLESLSNLARELEVQLKNWLGSDSVPNVDEWAQLADQLRQIDQVTQTLLAMEAPNLKPRPQQVKHNRQPLVYLLEDDEEQANHMALALREDGFIVEVWNDVVSFRSALATTCPDAIVLDLILGEGKDAGLALLAEMKAEQACDIPVVCVSMRDDFEARLMAYRAGASRYMHKPVSPEALIGVLNFLTGRIAAEPYRVVLVDDDDILLEAQSYVLQAAGMEVEALNDPSQILEVLDRFHPDVLILDVYMPDVNGPDLAAIIRERDEYLSLPIIFLSAESDLQQQLQALSLGGDDFLVKPVLPNHLISAVTARARRARQSAALEARLRNTLYERDREHLAINQHAIISITDKQGHIIDVNDKFCQVSGYSRKELLGQNHRIIKSGQHPAEFYQNLWRTISQGRVWQGVLCNRAKDGSLYWVESTITPFLDEDGQPYQFVAIRTDITHQLLSEQTVEEAKERLRRGQMFANVGTWEWNIVSGELFWTEQIGPLFGYPKRDLATSYDNFLNALHPDDRQAVIDAVTACIEKGKVYDIEHRVVWPDGTVRWLLEKGDVERDAEGKPIKMIGVVQDVHDRKLAEMALAERESQLIEAQSLARLGNWFANLKTGELFWSDEVYKIFGYQPGSFAPSVEAFKSTIHPDDVELVRESEKRAEQTGRHDVIHRIVRADGTVRYVHELAEMQVDESGLPATLTGTVQDVTELKESENSLKIFKRVFETTQQGIGVTDAQGCLIYSNPAHDRLHGYEPGECIGWHFSRFLTPDTLQKQGTELMAAIVQGKGWTGLLPIVRKDGSELITASSVGVISEQGKPQYLFNILVDYSAELERQNQLKLAKEEAERANRAKSDFLSSMSHELRTPLNSIIGFSQLLALSGLSDKQKDQLQTIASSGKHLMSLINDVLEFAKIESGKLAINIESVEVRPIIEQVIALSRSHAQDNDIHIDVVYLHDPVFILVDQVRFKQVLVNLMSNGIKYNRRHGTLSIHCRIQAHHQRSFWQCDITDTGLGIAPQDLPRLFVPFDRLGHETSTIEGTGIGLSITKDLVEQMGGWIEVKSEVNVGTTFSVSLPMDERVAHSSSSSATSDAVSVDIPKDTGIASKKRKVLYVEDNPANMKLMAEIAQLIENVELRIAPTAENGLDQAQTWLPELIFLDINLPGMNGDEAIAHFRALPGYQAQQPRIYAVTANVLAEQVAHYQQVGFDQVIAKPFDISHILELVDNAKSRM